MAFFFIVGTKDFTSRLSGYENTTAQCHNCGNWSAHCISSWEWFTFCWIPVIPLGKKHKDLACSICRFRQDLRNRQDVMSQQGGQGPPPQHHQGPPQGWGQQQGPPPQGYGPPPNQYK
ncbi:uncharacterized protein HMPREF1541_01044 [Cyphellophora europaea CBS 101466]|uniref:Zinc-ribbon 15 domain-containing protein n=1 Tax=Cyphellophora europaea (strain CBS 101466) TaxID=1220924 RepID=W2SDZ9_CYPE1|nr:uncharacterized protein HMPREF1541_01044 [Cyphellophora europaea CBS 101466]ETN46855.1 hypothetical protein HMPREF1541_01044 [Cyphellophora europaea CBS 101466]